MPQFSLCPRGKYPANHLREVETHLSKRICRGTRLLEKDEAGFELWLTPDGSYWTVEGNADTICWLLAEQEVDVYRVHSSMGIRQGDIVLDCGAHNGVFVRKALGLGAQLVVAVEVAPENIECLRRTFAAEIAEGRVIVYPKGVWNKDDVLVLARDVKTWSHRVTEGDEDKAGPEVPLTTIDRIVSELKLPRVDYIKMDIEGSERKAIAGAARTLAEFRPRMAIAAYHEVDDLEVLPAAVLELQPEYEMCLAGVGGGWGNLTLSFR